VWTSSLIDVFGRLGVEEKATRQALMRTGAEGWLAAERHGRRTRWHLTPRAEQLLTDGTQRIYGFRAVAAEWDDQILLVLARVPETDRATRHLLRSRLSWAGFGTPSPGVWISTHTERVDEVASLLSAAGVDDARIFRAEHVGGTELVSMVQQAWDLDSVEARYQDFLEEFARARAADPLSRLVELVHAWRRFPLLDPALPRELLPPRWSGERAATLFGKRHATWSADAMSEWADLERLAG
jgi:phenylacetic acid degradation operon negative regulatory protein